jgi:hypothetical protein
MKETGLRATSKEKANSLSAMATSLLASLKITA